MALPQKLVSFKIFTSNHFQTHVHRERERERERERAQITPSTSAIYEPIFDPQPSRHKLTNRFLSLCDFDFLCDFDRPTNRSMFLCDFDFLLSLFDLWFFCCWCGCVGGGVLVVFLLCGSEFCVDGGEK